LVRGLKEFTGAYLLAGEVLHWFIEHFLKKGPTAQAWLERTSIDRFDRAVRYSRDPVRMAAMRDEQYPPPMLVEFYYEDPRAEELADSARKSLLRGIRNFLEDDAVVALRRSVTAGDHWIEKRMAKLPKVDGTESRASSTWPARTLTACASSTGSSACWAADMTACNCSFTACGPRVSSGSTRRP
jgi:hypothetical protein